MKDLLAIFWAIWILSGIILPGSLDTWLDNETYYGE